MFLKNLLDQPFAPLFLIGVVAVFATIVLAIPDN
jgi:hypothetical protein